MSIIKLQKKKEGFLSKKVDLRTLDPEWWTLYQACVQYGLEYGLTKMQER
jgi:hypothetical protein